MTESWGRLLGKLDMPSSSWLKRMQVGGGAEPASTVSAPPEPASTTGSLNSNLKDLDYKETEQELDAGDGEPHDIYVPIHNYEGKHRYDPKAQWTPEEEKRLIRKV